MVSPSFATLTDPAAGHVHPVVAITGDPLTCLKSATNGWKQRNLCGIGSRDLSCAYGTNSKRPGVYSDVAKYGEWIERSRCKIDVGQRSILFKLTCDSISETPFRTYYGTQEGERIQSFPESTSDVKTRIKRCSEDVRGLSFDLTKSKIYYARPNRIYAATENGTGVPTFFEST